MPLQPQKTNIFLVVILILIGFSARLFPHPANFAPIGAIALFAGLYLPRRLAIILPLATMFLSDAIVGFYNPKIMIAVYTSFALVSLIGLFLRKRKNLGTIIFGTLTGSILFFLITNAAVWAFGTMYTHDVSGLMKSYTMALPFFRNSLLGDLFYTGIFVGLFESIQFWILQTDPQKVLE